MNLALTSDKEFIQKLTEIVEANLGDEKFGVKELAKLAGVNQSSISNRLNRISGKSLSQFIMEVRLRQAMQILSKGDITAAEAAFKVGFGSSTYFHKCFREHYGFPPGEVKKRGPLFKYADNNRPDTENIASEEVKNKPPFRRKIQIALFTLSAVALLAFLGFLAFFNEPGKNSGHADQKISIAVLPFVNLSDSPENKYFADGVMEDILSNLNRISPISVTSRTSVEKYRHTTKGVLEIARELGVRYILEGSVQKSSDKVRVRVQLIDARRDKHILSETYDRELKDIFFIQSNIAIHVANKLKAVLSSEETKRIEESPTRNVEAYSLYLKGRHFWYKRTREGFEKSIEYFTKAVETDPGYALAWAGLGDGYFYISWWNWYDPGRKEGYEMARKCALKALELDNNLSEAHVLMGNIYFWYEWNWQEAENEMSLAVQLNPGYYMAHWVFAELLDVLGRRREARYHINRALELDPVFYFPYHTSDLLYYNDGNFKNAVEEAKKALELNPDFTEPYGRIWQSYFHMDSITQTLQYLQMLTHSIDVRNKTNMNSGDSIRFYFNEEGMTGVLQWLTSYYYKKSPEIFIMAGQKEEALKLLEKYFEIHDRDLVRIISRYDYKYLRSEPRYLEIVRKMGLMDYYTKALASGQLPQ
jgi:TolB-like protein/AraC-like DNA-binding protein